MMKEYEGISDEELILRAQKGEKETGRVSHRQV